MKIAIMQPYILPYIGYFQLINAVDAFVVYDNIEFTKKGWINRNRILVNGKDDYFTIPLKKDSDYLNINHRYISESYTKDKTKIVARISELYKKSPYFSEVFPLIEDIFYYNELNLFDFVFYSIKSISTYLEITTKFIVSSTITIDHSLRSQDKVIAICNELNSTSYLNPIGGVELYSKEIFSNNGLQLNFIKSNPIEYEQFAYAFVPWLSIIDVLFFNSKEKVKTFLNEYTII